MNHKLRLQILGHAPTRGLLKRRKVILATRFDLILLSSIFQRFFFLFLKTVISGLI